MNKTKDMYIPGEEWVYYKLYTGVKTADTLILKSLEPLIKDLKRKELVDKWFFIRYGDPDFHLRVRIKVKDRKDLGVVMLAFYDKIKKFVYDSAIWKIDISSYFPENNRYGNKFMAVSETLFMIDSECTFQAIKLLKNQDENYRWMFALRMIDAFFDDIGFDLVKRSEYIHRMSESYRNEFGYTMYNAKQLNSIYRDRKAKIAISLDKKTVDPVLIGLNKVLRIRSRDIKKVYNKSIPENNVSSYIHMMMNRLFRSQNRIHELLIYDFLSRHYKSEIARKNIL